MVHDTCVYVCKRECVYVYVRVRVCAMIRVHMSNTIVSTNTIWHKQPTIGSLSLSRSRSSCLYNQDDGQCQLKGLARLAHAHTNDVIVFWSALAPLKAAWILCNGYIRHARHVCHVHTVPVLDPSFDSFTLNYILFLCRCVSGFLSRSTESASTSKREQTRERKSEMSIKR